MKGARFWGAVLVDGQPRAEVRDVFDLDEYKEISHERVKPEFRWFRVCALDYLEDTNCLGPCVPGNPCRACVQEAVMWWYTHAERTAERKWKAASLHARDRADICWDAADYCPCKNGHGSELQARRCAKKREFPLIQETDGHGKPLRWIEL